MVAQHLVHHLLRLIQVTRRRGLVHLVLGRSGIGKRLRGASHCEDQYEGSCKPFEHYHVIASVGNHELVPDMRAEPPHIKG
jgi:hypothetical protein